MSNSLTKAIFLFWRDTGKIRCLRKYRRAIYKFQTQVSRNTLNTIQSVYKTKFLRKNIFKYLAISILPCASLLSKAISADTSSDIEDNITHLIVLAKLALEKGDIEKAEALLYIGLKICEDYRMTYGLPFIYDILASIAFSQGDSEKAERLLVTAIERMIQDGVSESNDHVVDFKLRLARIYSGYKENTLAEIGFKTCLDTQKEKIMKGDMSTRTEAKKMIDRAYDYSLKIKGLSPYQEMVILYTLADLNMELGEYDVALSKMQTAVMLGKGISSSDLPKCYLKLAKIYMKLGVYDQAKSSAMEGEKLARMFNKVDTMNDAKLLLEELKEISK